MVSKPISVIGELNSVIVVRGDNFYNLCDGLIFEDCSIPKTITGVNLKISLRDYNRKCLYHNRYNFFNIHSMYFENDEWYLIVSDCFDIKNIKTLINTPHQQRNYFFNKEFLTCSCKSFKLTKQCEHRNLFMSKISKIKYYFTLVLYNNLGITLNHCLDILYDTTGNSIYF
jgi:hypothetical protein